MPQRHLARTFALQALAEWDFNKSMLKINLEIEEIIERNLRKAAPSNFEGKNFSKELVEGVVKNLTQINDYIKKYAPQWPLEQITLVDRNIIRLGIFELIFLKQTPPKVIINEAIEIAKTFGERTSGKFVNGVLGAIYEDIKISSKKINSPTGETSN
ncbi:MAG: transcription antitermination factor NusB [Patescibacteria group bacterium]|jgi:N utilization substance protein B|nr:transcription antitermination factor NusB [Patescibacteria group bacterium]MDD5172597.1 transcription antitermination factor NusB [Patescibacteria group bacterium]